MSEIVVPTPELDSPAARALTMEGLEVSESLCPPGFDLAYGELFSALWNRDEPFVICEHDIIPWPGAVTALLECPEPWCTHRYPLHRGNVALSFGIGKYIPQGPAPERWRETPWWLLDGIVVPYLRGIFGEAHVHEPPCAHARNDNDPH